MKKCPKCNNEHEKPGTFCSRTCANSRIFSQESKDKKSKTLKAMWAAMSVEERELAIKKLALSDPETRMRGTRAFQKKMRERRIAGEFDDVELIPKEMKNDDPKVKSGKWAKNYTPVKMCKICPRLIHYRYQYCDTCLPNIRHYRSRAKFTFNVYEYPDNFDLSLVEKHGWYSPNGYKKRNKTPNLDGVSRDHLYSISDGFKNKIDPKILSHPANCAIMIHNGPNGNNRKKGHSSITIEELLERIEQW